MKVEEPRVQSRGHGLEGRGGWSLEIPIKIFFTKNRRHREDE